MPMRNCEHSASLFNGISVSEVQRKNVEKITRAESANKEWYQFRAGRVTVSRMKAACSTPHERPSPSLVKTIRYPHATHFSTMFQASELAINLNMPYMGASQDSHVRHATVVR